jgi:hypothetical protein
MLVDDARTVYRQSGTAHAHHHPCILFVFGFIGLSVHRGDNSDVVENVTPARPRIGSRCSDWGWSKYVGRVRKGRTYDEGEDAEDVGLTQTLGEDDGISSSRNVRYRCRS